MRARLLEEIAQEYLVPFFSAATLEDETSLSNPDDRLVDLIDENRIAFKISPQDDYRLVLYRKQQFSKESDVVPETTVVRAFVDVVAEMKDAMEGPLRRDLLSSFQRRVVARAIAGARGDETILLDAIDQLASFSNRLYEGSPISAAIGFRNTPVFERDIVAFHEFWRDDYSAVLSNGQDTLIEFNFDGQFVSHVALRSGDPTPYCPLRQTPIADWTTKMERRVALTLNRLGEILIFRDRQLLFARRSGRWSFLTHRPIITQMGTFVDRDIRRAVYTSCIDASFARTGACIAIVSPDAHEKLSNVLNVDDTLQKRGNSKTRAISQTINDKNFQDLDRRLRQELLAIDGATILSDEGTILAVGAIVKIPSGSTGGGRLAAAKTLGKLGLGIKVSQDGGITGFRQRRSGIAFRLM